MCIAALRKRTHIAFLRGGLVCLCSCLKLCKLIDTVLGLTRIVTVFVSIVSFTALFRLPHRQSTRGMAACSSAS